MFAKRKFKRGSLRNLAKKVVKEQEENFAKKINNALALFGFDPKTPGCHE